MIISPKLIYNYIRRVFQTTIEMITSIYYSNIIQRELDKFNRVPVTERTAMESYIACEGKTKLDSTVLTDTIPKQNKVRFISIEGNIGAGKSTLLNHIRGYIEEYELNKDNHIVFLREPVDIWQNMKDTEGKNILELLYENPHKYAFEFQLTAYSSQIKLIDETLEKNPQCTLIISERCFEAGHNVFTKMLCDEGCISSIQYEIYKYLLGTRTNTNQLIHTGVPDKVLYLDLRPETCIQRIHKRGREEETPITLDYIKRCDKYYKNWLSDAKNINKVVFLDLNETDEFSSSANHSNIVFVIEQILST